jgi:hypothetical protein
LKNLYEYGTLSSEKMFGNDVALLPGTIERGEKEERKGRRRKRRGRGEVG